MQLILIVSGKFLMPLCRFISSIDRVRRCVVSTGCKTGML